MLECSDKNFILLDKPRSIYRTWGYLTEVLVLQISVTYSKRISWEALGRLRLGVIHPTLSLQTPSETPALTLEVGTQSGVLLVQDGQGVWILMRTGLLGSSETRLFSFRYFCSSGRE